MNAGGRWLPEIEEAAPLIFGFFERLGGAPEDGGEDGPGENRREYGKHDPARGR
jgi:hypothetical protein